MRKRKLSTPGSEETEPKANRSVVPIPDTIESIPGYPDKLVIFKVPASPYWWMRYYDDKHIKRSTKTAVKREAIAAAKKFYEDLLVNKRLNISNNPRKPSFATCAEEVLAEDERKVQRGELSASYVKNAKTIVRALLRDFFAPYEVGQIDYALLDKYRTNLTNRGLKPGSIKIHLTFVSKILDHAQRMGYIQTAPLSPKVKNEDNPRGYFNVKEYRRLRTAAHLLTGTNTEVKQNVAAGDRTAVKKLRNIVISRELHLLIGFMVYSFIRPTDIKQIKHKHIELRTGPEGEYLFMPIPSSKRHNKPITSMPRAAIFYKRLRQLRSVRGAMPDISDDFVFAPEHLNRNYAYQTLARQFDVVLKTTDLKEAPEGETRSLYSLRHTSLMYRIKYGGQIDPIKLANNARTSVEMLERFYLSKLESSQFTADLHAKKPRQQQKRENKTFITPPAPKKQSSPKTMERQAYAIRSVLRTAGKLIGSGDKD